MYTMIAETLKAEGSSSIKLRLQHDFFSWIIKWQLFPADTEARWSTPSPKKEIESKENEEMWALLLILLESFSQFQILHSNFRTEILPVPVVDVL